MRIYLDLVMGLNFLVDFLLLQAASRLSGFPTDPWRAAAAGVLGAVYSGMCLLPGFSFLGNLLWRLVSLGLMGAIAFGIRPDALKRTGLFLLLTMALYHKEIGAVADQLGKNYSTVETQAQPR